MMLMFALANAAGAIVTTTHQSLSPFATKALGVVSKHPIVQRNSYCEWFSKGEMTVDEAKDLVTQFSVFSNLFLLAQVRWEREERSEEVLDT